MGKPMAEESSITVNSTDLHYGDTVDYDYTLEKLPGREYPMVALTCYQDVDEDGEVNTDMFGPDIVYVAPLAHPGDPITVGSASGTSPWATRGGPAICRMDLYAYGHHAGKQTIRHLDSTEEFEVQNP